ncbi:MULTISPECIES: cytochrome-c oxidase, cbb3-type subunit II [Thalassotalea]|uniref:Cytochrome-c oxidase, cbb3-type subunit II n=1 Tax=Thalassotalea castellviae TaxID=3075612 RepID=A0ABU2ZVY6_9GAMM|nr:cytochrome-c oxidase, cbb3-type subunit II [Thalassotalea sp. W431]MDT0602095.1 cytochrome-c oxidase, cbb3-type subunit II [Thalassotalea sp. W431]
MTNKHEKVEKNVGLFFIFTILAISVGGLVEITPLFFQKATTTPVDNLRPYTALEMEGRDIYIREGCNVCHSQMIRPFRAETERYGHYSVAGETVWEHPFLWGSKRTGPDLARVGGRYSDDWHRAHLIDPRSVVPESNMPSFKWLDENKLDGKLTAKKLETFNFLTRNKTHKDEQGKAIPLYSAKDIAKAQSDVNGKTEMEALIAYLQSLGHALK